MSHLTFLKVNVNVKMGQYVNFNYTMVVSFIPGGSKNTQRKSLTCYKSVTTLISIDYILLYAGVQLILFVVMHR